MGIKIDTLKVFHYRVDGLYIKLDKKITLKADKVIIPKRKSTPSFGSVGKTLERVKYLLTFFEAIHLKEIDFDNNRLSIYFRDNILQLSSKAYLIRAKISRKGEVLKGEVPILQLKKQNILIKGHFAYDLKKRTLVTDGTFLLAKALGSFDAIKKHNHISFALKSEKFTQLKPIVNLFKMPKSVKNWVVDRVQAKAYRLDYLQGEGTIEDGLFKLDLDQLKGKLTLLDVAIDFKEGLAPVKTPHLFLTYDTKGLFFGLDRPLYQDKSLAGSRVSIVNLRENNTTLSVNLKLNTPFDATVKKLLNAYHVHTPLVQKEGLTNASVKIEVGLKKRYHHVVTEATFTKGDIVIGKVTLPVVRGGVHYENGVVALQDIVLQAANYAGTIDGKLNLKKRELNAVFDTQYLYIGKKKEPLLSLKKERLPFRLTYKNGINVKIPKLAVSLKHTKKESRLTLSNLSKVKAYLSSEIPIEEGGEATIVTKDFQRYHFSGEMKRSKCFLYEENGACKTRLPFRGTVTPTNIELYALGKKFYYNQSKSRVELNGIHIDLKRFLKFKDEKKSNKKRLVIIGKKSHLRYGEYQLLTESYDVEVSANGDINATGSAGGDIVTFSKTKDIFSLQALRIKDEILHPLIHFDGLKGGRYSIVTKGNPDKVMSGEIIVEGGVMKDFKAYNNVFAFINTLPALATLHNPGYSDKGFAIESGVVKYRIIHGDKIIFDSIYIKGKSATISGKGELDLKQKTIKIDLGIQTARELGKVIGSIPLVGYILVGKDKSLTVGLKIRGSLDKPEVSVLAAKDILTYPFELIKRTLTAPQNLIKQSQ